MPALREVFADFTFSFDSGKLATINRAVGAVTQKLGQGGTAAAGLGAKFRGLFADSEHAGGGFNGLVHGIEAVGAIAAGGLFAHITHSIADQLGSLQVLSNQTKISVTDLQALQLASSNAGGSAEDMSNALTLLQRSLAHLEGGTSPQVEAFKRLGVETHGADGQTRSLNDLLPDVFANFGNLRTDADRSAVAVSLFGRSGVRMIPVLEQGSKGLASMREELAALGGGATPEATEAAHSYEVALHKLDFAFMSIKGQIATQLFPALERLVGGAGAAVVNFGKWAAHTTLVKNGAIALAASLTFTLGKALAPYLKSGLKFAAIFLAVDDLIAFLSGKKSIIGSIIYSWFGPDTYASVKKWIADTRAAFSEFFDLTAAEGKTKFQAMVDAMLQPLEDLLNKLRHPFDSAGNFDAANQAAGKANPAKPNPAAPKGLWQSLLHPFAGASDFAAQAGGTAQNFQLTKANIPALSSHQQNVISVQAPVSIRVEGYDKGKDLADQISKRVGDAISQGTRGGMQAAQQALVTHK